MIPLLLTILCSSGIALILKQNDVRQGHPLVLLASLFVYAFFAFAKAVSIAGTALASVSSRLSVVIPIALSILLFREIPTTPQLLGFGFALLTLFCFYLSLKTSSKERHPFTHYFYLFALLLGIGFNDFCMKIFHEWRPIAEKPFFLSVIFTFSFLYTSGCIALKRIRWEKPTLLRGAVLGIPNVFSSFFLLSALARLPAIIVYPTVNIGIILLTTLGAALIWSDRLNRFGRWALLFGLIAILLLRS